MLEIARPDQAVGGDATSLTNSTQVVSGKLARIHENPDYAVRFVNLREYVDLLSRREIREAEATVFRPRSTDDRPLANYLHIDSKRSSSTDLGIWISAVSLQTETALHQSRNLQDFADLREMLKEARRSSEGSSEQSMSARVHQKFTEMLREDYRTRDDKYIGGLSPYDRFERSIASAIKEEAALQTKLTHALDVGPGAGDPWTEQVREKLRFLRAELSARLEASELLKRVYSGEIECLDRQQLRVVFRALSFVSWEAPVEPRGVFAWRQYQVAMVFDAKAASNAAPWGFGGEIRGWRFLKPSSEPGGSRPEDLLAAVALIPDKKLWEVMKDYSSSAGAYSHPIFDHHGDLLLGPQSK